MRRRQMAGVGNAQQTNVRLTALNREGIEAYAMSRRITINSALNYAVAALLHAEMAEWIEEHGVAAAGEPA